jgi:hypothetical protein
MSSSGLRGGTGPPHPPEEGDDGAEGVDDGRNKEDDCGIVGRGGIGAMGVGAGLGGGLGWGVGFGANIGANLGGADFDLVLDLDLDLDLDLAFALDFAFVFFIPFLSRANAARFAFFFFSFLDFFDLRFFDFAMIVLRSVHPNFYKFLQTPACRLPAAKRDQLFRVVRLNRGFAIRQAGKRLGHRPAGRPVDQLDGMDNRNSGAGADLHEAADIAGRNHIRLQSFDVGDLSIPQSLRQIRLQEVVGTCRAATQMAFRHIFDDEAGL